MEPRTRRRMLIIGGAIILALVLIAVSVSLIVMNRDDNPDHDLTPLQLNDILHANFRIESFNGTWIDDNSYWFFDEMQNILIYDVMEKKSEIVVTASLTTSKLLLAAYSYEFSPDKKWILFATNRQKVFRHTSRSNWYTYNIADRKVTPLHIGKDPLIQLIKWHPQNSSLIYFYTQNLYYQPTMDVFPIHFTFDGVPAKVSNGVPDWVNEEEVFATDHTLWFSTEGTKFVYLKFDDSHIRTISLPEYGDAGDLTHQYMKSWAIFYPKSGTNNPEVTMHLVKTSEVREAIFTEEEEHVHDIVNPTPIYDLPIPAKYLNEDFDHLITTVSWANDNILIVVFMNRIQNKGDIYKCDLTNVTAPVCEDILNLDVVGGWIDFFTAPFYDKEGTNMVFIQSSNGYRHLQSLNINTKVKTSLTSGKFVVTEILQYIKDDNVVLFTANTEEDHKSQHIYAIKNEINAQKVCLTCTLSNSHTYYTAEVSKSGKNMLINYSGPDIPQAHLFSVYNLSLTDHVEVTTNAILRNKLSKILMPTIFYDKIKLNENGPESQVMMIKPRDLHPEKKYPLLVEVYGGPDSASVNNRWSIEWGTYLASAHDIVYVKIDGRGSGLRGDENLFALYNHLGTVEVEDQIETTKLLIAKYPFIDANKTAIWGWSYGGYAAAMSLMNDHNANQVFHCAISVAPVTDWMLYDTIYTERYMGLPHDNFAAYNVSRVSHYIENIRTYDKKYMLVHGTADDNVHFQQGMLLARALERNDIQFKEVSYPDEDHSLAGVRPHLYHALESFLTECYTPSKTVHL